ncbi:P-loop containing nucleoside triphosphate hydrolase protein, partial [Mycena floridula]
MPSKNSLFCGRDAEVRSLVDLLTQQPTDNHSKLARICILGLGGIGKTELVLAVANDPEIKQYYSEENLFWVSCVPASSPDLLLNSLCKALGVPQDSNNILHDILTHLRSSPRVLLLLDNFETPWNANEARSDVARILQDIEGIPHVALLVTMRGSHAPCEGITWTERKAEALAPDASRQLFTQIDNKADEDPDLPQLLDLLCHMPLAITLMARHGKQMCCTTHQLLDSFNRTGIAMLGSQHGSDRQNSITISIKMSVQGDPMKREPDALNLLAIVAMPPAGASFGSLRGTWATEIPILGGPLAALLDTALLEQRDTKFHVHPLIASYVLDPSRIPESLRSSMLDAACRFLAHHRSYNLGETSYKADLAARSSEEINLQAILLEASTPDHATIEALLILSWHQYRTRSRTEVIQHAVSLARECPDSQLYAETLRCYGVILWNLDRYEESLKQYTLARKKFLEISNTSLAARTLLNIAEVYAMIHSGLNPIPLVEQAIHEFKSIPDEDEVLRGLVSLGLAHINQNNYTEAIAPLKDARQRCVGLCRDGAQCVEYLSLAYHQLGQ